MATSSKMMLKSLPRSVNSLRTNKDTCWRWVISCEALNFATTLLSTCIIKQKTAEIRQLFTHISLIIINLLFSTYYYLETLLILINTQLKLIINWIINLSLISMFQFFLFQSGKYNTSSSILELTFSSCEHLARANITCNTCVQTSLHIEGRTLSS